MPNLDPRAELKRLRDREELKRLRDENPPPPPEPMAAEHPSSQIGSGLQGAAQGASFGFSDELLAGAKAAYDKMKEGGGTFASNTPYGEFYNKRVQSEREAVQRAKEDNPLTYTGGMLGGTALSNFIPGVGIARGAKLGATLGKAALQGGLVGAGESVPKDQGELLSDVGWGAATGLGTQGIFSGLGGIAGKLSPKGLDKFAEERVVKAAIGPSRQALRNALGLSSKGAKPEEVRQGISKLGRNLLDEDIVRLFQKTEDLGPALENATAKYGQQIGDIGTKIDEAVPGSFDPRDISNKMMDYASNVPISASGDAVQNRVLKEAKKFEDMANNAEKYNLPGLGFKNAQGLKDQYRFKQDAPDALISNQDAINAMKRIVGEGMEEAAAKAEKTGGEGVEDLLKRYQTAKAKYGSFKGASDATGSETANELMRRLPSPSDYAFGAGGLGLSAMNLGEDDSKLGPVITGALALAGHKFARQRGSSTAAVIANNLSKKMKSSPEFVQKFGRIMMDAAERGPAALTATHLMLMKEPSYSQQFLQPTLSAENRGIQ